MLISTAADRPLAGQGHVFGVLRLSSFRPDRSIQATDVCLGHLTAAEPDDSACLDPLATVVSVRFTEPVTVS